MFMEQLVKIQRQYFNSNATKSIDFRIAQLKKLKDVIEANEGLLLEAIYKDYGKQEFATFISELNIIHDEIKDAIRNLKKWYQPKPVATNILNSPGKSYILPEPLGVSLVIGPWNYPYQLTLGPVVAAISAGCTIILKPSELTIHSSGLLAKLVTENFDQKYFTVVEGGIPETTALLEQKFDMIFFTGSVPVGKIVYLAAAKQLTPVVLELGGKSPAIFMPDSKLDITIKRLVFAKFFNAGQTCIAPDYVLVHKSIEQEFLLEIAKEIKGADYKIENGNYVNIINTKNTTRITGLIDPKKIYVGGAYDIEKRFIEPTIMNNISWNDKVMQEEIFGPVLPILIFEELDDIITKIKERSKPLSLYLFTQNESVKTKVLSEISFGGGCINEAVMHVTNVNLPFGGVGNSGIGNYHGEAGFKAFSHYKSILDKDVKPDLNLKYSPHTDKKLKTLKSLLGYNLFVMTVLKMKAIYLALKVTFKK
jgi:aldehyde dehydrogenase (NAD+)